MLVFWMISTTEVNPFDVNYLTKQLSALCYAVNKVYIYIYFFFFSSELLRRKSAAM
jgi:hypothetical protein